MLTRGKVMFKVELEEYKKKGYSILRGFFSECEVSEIKLNIEDFILNKIQDLKGREVNYVDGEVNSIHALNKSDNFFSKLANTEKVKNVASVFLNAPAELRGAELFAKPAKVGLQSPMHQDNFYWCVSGANALTMWVALEKCGSHNGGLTYIEGSQLCGLVEHNDSFAPGSSQKINEDILSEQLTKLKRVTPDVEPGDVLIHHSLTFHGSDANKSEKSRRGFTMQFKDETANYDQDMLKHYEKQLEMQVKNRANK